jgi:hypothetical protein
VPQQVLFSESVVTPVGAGARGPRVRAHSSALLWIGLLLIMVTALAVRAYGLTDYGIWFDEAYHIALVSLPSTGEMLGAVLANPPSDPLYVLLLRGWVGLFGLGDASVRAMSVLFGTFTVPAAFALGTLLAGRFAGLAGAGLVALSPYAVEFSQEAALYALAALSTTTALALGIWWQRTGRGGVAYVLVGTLAIYSHYVVPVVIALFALGSLLPPFRTASRISPRTYLFATGGAFALWLPWLVRLVLSWNTVAVPRSSLPQDLTASDVIGALAQYTAGTAPLLTGSRPLLLTGLLAGAVLLAAAWRYGGAPERRYARLLVAVAAVVFAAPAIAAFVMSRWLFVPHFMLFLLPALCAVAGASVVWAKRELAQSLVAQTARWTAPAALGLLVVANLGGLWQYYMYPPHGADGLRELASVLRRDVRPGEITFVTPPALAPSLAHYYGGDIVGLPEDFDLRRVYLLYDGDSWRQRSIERVTASVAQAPRFWLVYRPERDAGGSLLAYLTAEYEVGRTWHYGFGTLYEFEVP